MRFIAGLITGTLCTYIGWIKIIEALQNLAEMLRDKF